MEQYFGRDVIYPGTEDKDSIRKILPECLGGVITVYIIGIGKLYIHEKYVYLGDMTDIIQENRKIGVGMKAIVGSVFNY